MQASTKSSLNLDMDRLKLAEPRRRPVTGLSRSSRGSSTGSSLSSLSPDDERPRPLASSRAASRSRLSQPRQPPPPRPVPQRQLSNNSLANLAKLGNRPTKVIESSSEFGEF